MRIPEGLINPVTTSKGFTVKELKNEEVEEIKETVKVEAQAYAFFSARVIAWPFEEECNTENKRKLMERSYSFCIKQINEANNLITKQKEEELENLLSGANGATHPAD